MLITEEKLLRLVGFYFKCATTRAAVSLALAGPSRYRVAGMAPAAGGSDVRERGLDLKEIALAIRDEQGSERCEVMVSKAVGKAII